MFLCAGQGTVKAAAAADDHQFAVLVSPHLASSLAAFRVHFHSKALPLCLHETLENGRGRGANGSYDSRDGNRIYNFMIFPVAVA